MCCKPTQSAATSARVYHKQAVSRMSSTTDEEDNGSLFGSPPPSPVPPDSFERNIGIIALPGSHMSCSGPPAHTLSRSISAASNLAVAGTPQASGFDTTDDGGLRSQGSQYSQRSTVDKRNNQKRSSASSRSSTTNRSTNAGPLLLSRNEILENARERQRQLVAELECAKVELWEASIEGGVLVHLMRDNKINPHRSVG